MFSFAVFNDAACVLRLPSPETVFFTMYGLIHEQHEVVRIVVPFIVVHVVNDLAGKQGASEFFFHDPTMFMLPVLLTVRLTFPSVY